MEEIAIDGSIINNKIYEIRGQKVMLDYELAEIYGYTTMAFNQQVSRNKERFDDDFYFQLTKDEYRNLISQNVISSLDDGNLRSQNVTSSWGGRRKMPYVFTEQGIYMLMTILKGDLAVRQSKALVRMFKDMKDFLSGYDMYVNREEIRTISEKIDGILVEQNDIRSIVKGFIDGDRNEVFLSNGKYADADMEYKRIYNMARETIFIVDNYINLKTLVLLKDIKDGVKCTIFSNNIGRGLHIVELDDFRKQYPNIYLKFKEQGKNIHDRFIIVDYGTDTERFFHCGGSSKDSGKRKMVIDELKVVNDVRAMVKSLMGNKRLEIGF